MAADVERSLLNHYQLTNLYPSEWPKRDDDSAESEDEQPIQRNTSIRSKKNSRRLSRFSGLDSRTNYKSRLSGTEEIGGGSGNIVQKDEPDPLGISPSVVSQLRARGLSVEDNLKLRNRFMLSSTTFSPSLFLSQIHQTATTDELLQGLDFLSRSIEKKSASLKVLVESNFERFVKAKATIDNVYTEMRTQGVPQTQGAPRAAHGRVSSRGHFRNSSNPFSPVGQRPVEDQRKNTLTKESEYGVQGIKVPLLELSVKADEVWGPALSGKDRGKDLKSISTFIERHRGIFQYGGRVSSSIRRREYETLVHDYQAAKQKSQEAKSLLDQADNDPSALSEENLFTILATGKMWYDVETQANDFRRVTIKQLTDADPSLEAGTQEDKRESHAELIAVLLQIGTVENPIWLWLSSWHSRLRDKIFRTFERARLDLEILRRKLAARGQPSDDLIKAFLQSAATSEGDAQGHRLDSDQVVQFWGVMEATFEKLLNSKSGLLGDIADYWDNARSYMDGRAQKDLPNSVWSADGSRQHLHMSGEHMRQLQRYTTDLVGLLREATATLFLEPPIEDVSDVFSPAPDPREQTPLTPTDRLRFMGLDPSDLPPQTPKIGEAWERFAFWPPHANALSGARYLSRVLAQIGASAIDATAISVVKEDSRGMDSLRNMIGSVRERCVQAVCAAWGNDADHCRLLEDWTRNSDRKDLTNMPLRFLAFEETLLMDTQKILYVSEAMTRPNSSDMILPPSTKLLQMVRSQFVTSLYKALSGAVENAERPKRQDRAVESAADDLTTPLVSEARTQEATVAPLAMVKVSGCAGETERTMLTTSKSIRMLLTLSNFKHLQRDLIPQLISQFETLFSVQLTEESGTIRDVLAQIDTKLFHSYMKPTVARLTTLISAGIADPAWMPRVAGPTNARPYVYDVLLELVLVHTEVTTSAANLTSAVLSHHLEQISTALLNCFKQRSNYSLAALMQATLDIELTAQTLSNYTTEAASETQSQIYLTLDERTDDGARKRLQDELPEMRATLKKLRESTKGQFGCFKKDRKERGRDGRPGSSRQ